MGEDRRPIGVFDSGAGGLSVLGEIRALLPHEELLYVADAGHVPYGEKSPGYIQARSLAIAEFLLAQGCKALVVACNTATAAAVALLRERFAAIPIVAIEPAVKPAAAATRSGIVGVLATSGTLESARFAALLDRFANGVRVLTQPCPGLVECVERAELDGPDTRALLERYTGPLLQAGADTLILGCTHYPFLKPLLAELAGPEIALIDTGAAVARRLRQQLQQHGLLAAAGTGTVRYWTSGEPARLARLLTRLGWTAPVALLPAGTG
ncbi:MAG TPA: glutamate racemase [Candidatus Competibacteraceae bacterium]|nr:glutamate racemase [Candidatus Competibacteraceae bacterium]